MLKREITTLGSKPGAASTALVPASRPKTGTVNNKTVVTFNNFVLPDHTASLIFFFLQMTFFEIHHHK